MSDSLEQVFGLNVKGLTDLERLNRATQQFNKNLAAVSSTSASFNEVGKILSQTITGQIDKYRTLTQVFAQTDKGYKLVNQSMSVNTQAMQANAEAMEASARVREKLLQIQKDTKTIGEKVQSTQKENVLVQDLIDKQKQLTKLQSDRGKNVLVTERNILIQIDDIYKRLVQAQEKRKIDPTQENLQAEKRIAAELTEQYTKLKNLKETRGAKAVTATEKKALEELITLQKKLQELKAQPKIQLPQEKAIAELTAKRIKAEEHLAKLKAREGKRSTLQLEQENQAKIKIKNFQEQIKVAQQQQQVIKKQAIQVTKEEENTLKRIAALREKLNKLQATRAKKTGSQEEVALTQELAKQSAKLQAIQSAKTPVDNILKQKALTQELIHLQKKLKNLKETDPRNQRAIETLTEQINKTQQLSDISKQTSLVVARATEKERQLAVKRNHEQQKQIELQEKIKRANEQTVKAVASVHAVPQSAEAEITRQAENQRRLNSLREKYNHLLKDPSITTQQKDRIKALQNEIKQQIALSSQKQKAAEKTHAIEIKNEQIRVRRLQLDQQAIKLDRVLFGLKKQFETIKSTPEAERNKQIAIRERLITLEKQYKNILKDPAASMQQKELAQAFMEVTKIAQQRTVTLQKAAEREIANNKKILEQKAKEAQIEKRIQAIQKQMPQRLAQTPSEKPHRVRENLEAQRRLLDQIIAKQRELSLLRRDPRVSQAQKYRIGLMQEELRQQQTATQRIIANQQKQIASIQKTKSATDSLILSWKNAARVFQFIILHRAFMAFVFSIRQGIADAIDFSVKIASIRTISDRAATSTAQWTSIVRQLSEEFANPILDTAEGVYLAVSNQITKAAANSTFLHEAMKLSITSISTFSEAVSASSAILNAFNMSQDRAAEVNALLFQTAELGRVRLTEFANTIGRVASLSNELGVSLLEQQAALATLTIQGVKHTRAETFLVNIYQKLIRPSEELQRIYREWGVTSGEAAIKTFGFIGVMQRLEQETMRGGDRLKELGEIFQRIRAVTGAAALDLVKYRDSMERMSEATIKYNTAFEEVMESAGKRAQQQITILKNFFTVDVGDSFLNALLEISDALGGMNNMIQYTIATVKTLGSTFITLLAAKKIIGTFLAIKGAAIAAGTALKFTAIASKTFVALTGGPVTLAIAAVTTALVGFSAYTKAATALLEKKCKQLIENIKENYATAESLKVLTQIIVNNNAVVTHWTRNNRQMGSVFGQATGRMWNNLEDFGEKFKEIFEEKTKAALKAFEDSIDQIKDRIKELDKIIEKTEDNIIKLHQDLDQVQFENYFNLIGLHGAKGFDIIDNRLAILKENFEDLARQGMRARFGIFDPVKLAEDKQRIIEIQNQIKNLRAGHIDLPKDEVKHLIQALRQELALINVDPLVRIQLEMQKIWQEQFRLNQIKQEQKRIEEDVSNQELVALQQRFNDLIQRNPYEQLAQATTDRERELAEYRIGLVESTLKHLEQKQKEHNQKYGGDIQEAFNLEHQIAKRRIDLINKRIEAENRAAANAAKIRQQEQQRLQEQEQQFERLKKLISSIEEQKFEGIKVRTGEDFNTVFRRIEQQEQAAIAQITEAQALLTPDQIETYRALQQKITQIKMEAEAHRRDLTLQSYNQQQDELERQAKAAEETVSRLSEKRREALGAVIDPSIDILTQAQKKLEEQLLLAERAVNNSKYLIMQGYRDVIREEEEKAKLKIIQERLDEVNRLVANMENTELFTVDKSIEDIEKLTELLEYISTIIKDPIESAKIGKIHTDLEKVQEQEQSYIEQQKIVLHMQQQIAQITAQMYETAETFANKDLAAQKQIMDHIKDRTKALNDMYRDTIKYMDEIDRRINRKPRTGQAPGQALGGFPRGSDRQLAWVDRREFIMNPEASATFRPILEALNSQRVPSRTSNSTTNVGGITVTVNGGDSNQQTIREIASGLQREIRLGRIKF